MTPTKPRIRPHVPLFSSGPCAKIPGWSPQLLEGAVLGRSHRSPLGKARLQEAIDRTRALLNIPSSHVIGIVPASDTGAMEMALWSLLGERGVDVLSWESFGRLWARDIQVVLGLQDVRHFEAPYGALPDLSRVDPDRDCVFPWNGTTSGVRVPHGEWILDTRSGLVICDATSAVFAQDLPFSKLDVVTFSWQKALGSEAAHGMIVLSPRAIARLETYTPPWPIPKILRLATDRKVHVGIFEGETINTPSMLCVEDYLVCLRWAEGLGGLGALAARCARSAQEIWTWLETSDWAENLAKDPQTASVTSVCICLKTPREEGEKRDVIAHMVQLLEAEGVAYDIKNHRDAPPSLRIWCGVTVDRDDVTALLPWLDWAHGVALGR